MTGHRDLSDVADALDAAGHRAGVATMCDRCDAPHLPAPHVIAGRADAALDILDDAIRLGQRARGCRCAGGCCAVSAAVLDEELQRLETEVGDRV